MSRIVSFALRAYSDRLSPCSKVIGKRHCHGSKSRSRHSPAPYLWKWRELKSGQERLKTSPVALSRACSPSDHFLADRKGKIRYCCFRRRRSPHCRRTLELTRPNRCLHLGIRGVGRSGTAGSSGPKPKFAGLRNLLVFVQRETHRNAST